MSEQLATSTPSSTALCMFATSELFELVQRQAKLIAASDLIPKQFQGNIANCAIALEMASRLGASPFAVIQNLDVIHGRPSWRAVFLMGLVNNCGRFTPIQFKVETTGPENTVELTMEGWENQKKFSRPFKYTYTPTRCTAWAKDKSTGDVVEGPPVSYDMAIEEGWVSKSGSKWQTSLRELMLRYRAASFFAKVYASDVMLGMQTSEEAYDIGPAMRDVTPHADTSATVPTANPYTTAETPAATADEAQPAKAARKPRAAKDETAATPAADPAPPKPKAEKMRARTDMVPEIKAAFRAAGLASPESAAAMARQAGYMADKNTLGDLTDAEMFELWKVRDTVFTGQTDSATAQADDNDAGSDFPMDGEPEGGNE